MIIRDRKGNIRLTDKAKEKEEIKQKYKDIFKLNENEKNSLLIQLAEDLGYKKAWEKEIKKKDELARAKELKILELNSDCESTILNGFVSSNGNKYGFNDYDQMNFTQQMLLLVSDPNITQVEWKTENTGIVVHTRDEFLKVVKEAELHKRLNMEKYWKKKYLVSTLTSKEDVGKIKFLDTTPPNVPSNLQGTVNVNDVSLAWDAVTGSPDLVGYNIYKDGVKINTELIGTNSHTLTGVTSGTYKYQVTSIDMDENESAKSFSITVTV